MGDRTQRPLLAIALLTMGCAPSAAVYACPDLEVNGYHWVGAVGPPGTVGAYERVTLQVEDEVLDGAAAGADGSFVLRGAHHGDYRRGVRPEIHAGGHTIARLDPGAPTAVISYAPGARPVVEQAPMVRFTGELDATSRLASPIRETYVVNWRTHAVAPANARIDEAFSAEIPGLAGDCISVLSVHDDGTTGGCWWPGGGGCICHHCTLEAEAAGACIDSTDPQHLYRATEHSCSPVPGETLPPPSEPGGAPSTGGRTPLPADERNDPQTSSTTPPPPDRGGEIPTGRPAHDPPDAGPPSTDPPGDSGFPS